MSDTPRTDEAVDNCAHYQALCDMVEAEFARELERELNEVKANADALADAIEYTLKADAILHPETDHVADEALETYRTKYPQ